MNQSANSISTENDCANEQDELNFTRGSERKLNRVVHLEDFEENDAEKIFDCLKNELRLIPFCDYLKRYIYRKADMSGNYNEIDIKTYQRIILNSFELNNAQKSFGETSTKLSAMTKNWLTQASVSRETVFILGFGLNMSIEDVTSFLRNTLGERSFNFKDPREVIFWYCFKDNFKFQKAVNLLKTYNGLHTSSKFEAKAIDGEKTSGVRDIIYELDNEQALLKYLAGFKAVGKKPHSVTAHTWFMDLYNKSRAIIADYFNKDERYKQEIGVKESADFRIWRTDDITESHVEEIICCGIPTDKHGNLVKFSMSQLSDHFSGKRLSKQHLYGLLKEGDTVDRFDLITLNFFLYSQDENITDTKERYMMFKADTNKILNECDLGELYAANPYECFLLMCILTEAPLAAYADVWDKSFAENLSPQEVNANVSEQ